MVDVFPLEPKHQEEVFHSPLIGIPNVILTPHLGSYALEGKLKMEIDAVNNLINFLNKKVI